MSLHKKVPEINEIMGAFAMSYKLEIVFVGLGDAALAKVSSALQPDIDLAVWRVHDRTDGQAPGIVGEPDSHIALAFDQTVRTENLRFYPEAPLLSKNSALLLPSRDAHRDLVH